MNKYSSLIVLVCSLSFNAYSCGEMGDKTVAAESNNGRFSVCITDSEESENYKITLREKISGAYKNLSVNDSLFHGGEELTADISNDGNLSLVSLNPKDTYDVKVLVVADNAYLVEACHTVITDSPAPDVEAASQIVLCRNYPSKTQNFSTASGEGVFDSSKLIFSLTESSSKLLISAEKTFLFSESNESSVTKMYLVKGDFVEVLNSDKQWLFVRYVSNKKKVIEKWINVSAVL